MCASLTPRVLYPLPSFEPPLFSTSLSGPVFDLDAFFDDPKGKQKKRMSVVEINGSPCNPPPPPK